MKRLHSWSVQRGGPFLLFSILKSRLLKFRFWRTFCFSSTLLSRLRLVDGALACRYLSKIWVALILASKRLTLPSNSATAWCSYTSSGRLWPSNMIFAIRLKRIAGLAESSTLVSTLAKYFEPAFCRPLSCFTLKSRAASKKCDYSFYLSSAALIVLNNWPPINNC